MDYRCYACLTKSFVKLLEEHEKDLSKREDMIKDFLGFLASAPEGLIAPEVARMNQYKMKEILNVQDPYKNIKYISNKNLLDRYSYFEKIVENSNNSFDTAIRLAIAGNIIDYAANPDFNLEQTIENVLVDEFGINDSILLKEKIEKADKILYLADNAGEIVMDKLFLQTIKHPNVIYVVREAPVINDVTLEDVKQTGIDKYCSVIKNGYDAPSTIINKASKEFLDHYKDADIIISKGQGNYEGLLDVKDDRIFFLMMIKCEMVAERLNTKKGSFVVCRNK
ncbi:MAG: ARMT1-like domain-containing protein [Marinifilaceae bacterium]|jgi:uncharacterized protein with ATP-grasp and redox domains|nr:ARMT1-like domain-containing protein [Marinifilaceae bacterium]